MMRKLLLVASLLLASAAAADTAIYVTNASGQRTSATLKGTGSNIELQSNKGAANGYAGLNGSSQVSASVLPAPSASTLGGVQSKTATTHQFLTSIDTAGVPAAAQPVCGDLSNAAASCSTDATRSANISGTATNDNAAAGKIGEFAQAQLASGSPVSLTTATPANITSQSLTAGDWECEGVIDYSMSAATVTAIRSGTSSSTGAFGPQDSAASLPAAYITLTDVLGHQAPRTRYSLAGTTTVYLVGQATFSAGSIGAYGTLNCRRAR